MHFGILLDHMYEDSNVNTTRKFEKLEEEITRISTECIDNRLRECEYDIYEAPKLTEFLSGELLDKLKKINSNFKY